MYQYCLQEEGIPRSLKAYFFGKCRLIVVMGLVIGVSFLYIGCAKHSGKEERPISRSSMLDQAAKNPDSMLSVTASMLHLELGDSLHYLLNETRAMAWKAKSNRDSMMTYLYRNYERSLTLGNREMQAESLRNIVSNSKYIYDNVAYVRMLQELTGLYRKLNKPYDQASTQSKFGELPANLVGLPEVQKNLFEALAIFDSLGDGKMKVLVNLRIGNVFWEIGSTEEAKKYYNQALSQASQLQDTVNLINVYNNIGLLYRNLIRTVR
jgi:tetratricopeptide (TPR) repeat protein